MAEIIQILCCFIPLAGIIALLKKQPNKVTQNLLVSSIGCLIMNLGYLLERKAVSEETLISVKQISYVGNAAFYFFFVFFVLDYLQVNYPRWLRKWWGCFEVFGILCLFHGRLVNLVISGTRQQDSFLQIETALISQIRYGIIATGLAFSIIYTIKRMLAATIGRERRNLQMLSGSQFLVTISMVVRMSIPLPFNVVPFFASLSLLAIILYVIRGDFLTVADTGREWVFEHIKDAFIIVDEKYGYLDSNAYAKRIFPELGKSRKNALLSENIRRIFFSREKELKLGEKYYEHTLTVLKQGSETVGYGILLVDVTDNHQLMQNLVEAKEQAESANRAKSAFLSNMSHEIRTPMNAVVGMTEILLRENHSDKETGYLCNIKNSGMALLTIINDILDFSKVESGKMEIVEDEYAPASMLSDLKMILLNRIGEKDIDLQFEIDPGLPLKLYGDSMRLRQIIINIANNAIKFTEEGFVRLTVRMQEERGDSRTLHFSVEDSGQGIRKEDLQKLFAAFEQVDTKKNHNKEGTGLGLAISKQLVELMGGSISVESEYGKGSIFSFTICQKARSSEVVGKCWENAVRAEKEPTAEYLEFTAPKARLLIVDDNDINREVADLLLEPIGMQTDFASNGKEAVQRIQENRYDIVLMDHRMPVMDGMEAAAAIRGMEGEYYRNLPIIALTADAQTDIKDTLLNAGMNDFVTKPIETKELYVKIKHFLPDGLIQLR